MAWNPNKRQNSKSIFETGPELFHNEHLNTLYVDTDIVNSSFWLTSILSLFLTFFYGISSRSTISSVIFHFVSLNWRKKGSCLMSLSFYRQLIISLTLFIFLFVTMTDYSKEILFPLTYDRVALFSQGCIDRVRSTFIKM